MTDTFNFPVSADASGEAEPVNSRIKFNDGYEQEAILGMPDHAETQRWSVTFNGYRARAQEVVDFLRAHKGVAFFWKPPLGVAGYYKYRRYRISPQGAGYFLVNMEFEQVYAP